MSYTVKAVLLVGAFLGVFLLVFWYFSFDEGVERSEFAQAASYKSCDLVKALGKEWDASAVKGVEWEAPPSSDLEAYGSVLGSLKQVGRYDTSGLDYQRGRETNRVSVTVKCDFAKGPAEFDFDVRRIGADRWHFDRVTVRSPLLERRASWQSDPARLVAGF